MSSALPGSWHPSGKFLAYEEAHLPNGTDLMILGWKATKKRVKTGQALRVPRDAVRRSYDPEFSSDGRWIAYSSNESGPGTKSTCARFRARWRVAGLVGICV